MVGIVMGDAMFAAALRRMARLDGSSRASEREEPTGPTTRTAGLPG
ncbi:hypothetical protein AB0D46_01370 [Streptomyces sp. NPDC048383]